MFLLTYFNYASLRAVQSIWAAASQQIISVNKYEIGLLNASFLFFYAVFGVFSGALSDKYNKG